MAKVEFLYNGDKIYLHCDENDILEKIIHKFCQKIELKSDDMVFLYGGKFIDKNLTFIELANSIDKKRKIISIVVNDILNKDNNSELLKENKELKEKLNEVNKTIEELKKENQDLKYEITKIKSEGMTQVNSLMEIIKNKDKEINQLKDKQIAINNNNNNNNTKTIYILHNDKRIFTTTCLGSDTFSKVEEEFFDKNPFYKRNILHFNFKGKSIQSYETIDEIGIQNGDIVTFDTISIF